MNKKLFVIDLDGTLLSKTGDLNMEIALRINKLIGKGAYITFATGRDLVDVLAILKEIQLETPLAAYNGSAIYDPGKKELLHYWALPAELLKVLTNELLEYTGASVTFVQNNEIKKGKLCTEIIEKFPILSISVCDKKNIINIIYENIGKMKDDSGIDIQKYSDPLDDSVYVIDITSSYGDKKAATQYIAQLLDIETKDIVAFGNDSNDISLLQIVGIFCAVGDNEQELLKKAHHKLAYNEGFSVVDYIEKTILHMSEISKGIRIPEQGWDSQEIASFLEPQKSSRSKGGHFMGYPQTTPHPMALKAYEKYLPYNTNQVGVFSNVSDIGSKTRKMEFEVLQMLGKLYGITNPDGYITSGGTEGNIVGIWCARNLLSKSVKETFIVKTELSHSSVSKAANLMNLPEIIIKNDDGFFMDLADLRKQINVIASADTGIILIATLGYTNTGTCDDIFAISDILVELEEKYGVRSYIHIDAAIGGLVYPFIDYGSLDFFRKKNVMSMTIDPHKMGYLPFSCGVFLGRNDLLSNIEVKCSYSKMHRERTLIGSRNGAAAAACWGTLMNMGVDGYRTVLLELIEKKTYMLQQLEKGALIKIISNPPTNMCTVQFYTYMENQLPYDLEEKYAMHSFVLNVNNVEEICYKIYIMPHLEYATINEFVEDLKKLVQRCDVK